MVADNTILFQEEKQSDSLTPANTSDAPETMTPGNTSDAGGTMTPDNTRNAAETVTPDNASVAVETVTPDNASIAAETMTDSRQCQWCCGDNGGILYLQKTLFFVSVFMFFK